MWQFNSPEIVFGEDSFSRLADLSGQRAFIVSDPTLVNLGYVDQVRQPLVGGGFTCEQFTEVEPEPSIETVLRLRDQIGHFEPDWIVALGGGSVLDAAKVAWLLYERPELGIEEISIFTTYQTGRANFVAIPTTSGTGADVTVGAVISDHLQGRKLSIYTREFQPTITIVDPRFVIGLPAQITADTGMDVLSHAIEAFTSPWHNDFADGLCLKAVQLVFEYLPRAYANGQDLEAREHMHNAATLAGLAITNSSVALGHALAHAFGGIFPLPHGRLVGLFLPYTMEYTALGGKTRYAELARVLGLEVIDEPTSLVNLIRAIHDLAWAIGQPLTIHDLGLKGDQLAEAMPELVMKAAEDPQMLTSLRVPDEVEIARLFLYAFEGHTVDF